MGLNNIFKNALKDYRRRQLYTAIENEDHYKIARSFGTIAPYRIENTDALLYAAEKNPASFCTILKVTEYNQDDSRITDFGLGENWDRLKKLAENDSRMGAALANYDEHRQEKAQAAQDAENHQRYAAPRPPHRL